MYSVYTFGLHFSWAGILYHLLTIVNVVAQILYIIKKLRNDNYYISIRRTESRPWSAIF